jgi:predicted kinase
MATLTLIRGIPGSGKSTMAKQLVADEVASCHFEADMWIDYAAGFDQSMLRTAHANCIESARHALHKGQSVVVSNTFTRRWEMQPYMDMAKQYGSTVNVITATGNYGSIHNVPDDVIKAMRDRWEDL